MVYLSGNSNQLVMYNGCDNIFFLHGKYREKSISLHADNSNQPLHVESMCLTPCGNYILIAVGKKLVLYNASDDVLANELKLDKISSSMRCFNKSKVVLLADKSGMLSFYSYSHGLVKLDHVIGHTSMLTDALISDEDDYIITCDRDEKIRVTQYPNVYNIHNFCLGHQQFVSSMCFLPSNHRILISASGDGTVRLWNWKKLDGKQLYCYESIENEHYIKVLSEKRNQQDIIALQVFRGLDITLLRVEYDKENVELSLHSKISANSLIVDIIFYGEMLLYLTDSAESPCRAWPSDELSICSFASDKIKVSPTSEYNILFKREFDTVQEYYTKKKARISAK